SPRLSLCKTTPAINEIPTSTAPAANSHGHGVEPIGRPVRRAHAHHSPQTRNGMANNAARLASASGNGGPIEPVVEGAKHAGRGAPDVLVLVGGGVEPPDLAGRQLPLVLLVVGR